MLDFIVDRNVCQKCGLCAKVCPANIIDMIDGHPSISPEKEENCYRCQHCFTACSTGAISILGRDPKNSRPVEEGRIDPDRFEIFIKGRRSARFFRDEDLDPALIRRLLDVAWHAPSGRNDRHTRFTVIDKKDNLAKLRELLVSGIEQRAREGTLPEGREFVADLARMWTQKKVDVIFRGAPHLLIVSSPKRGVSPVPDCLIALSYFDLFAQSLGVGTLWGGFVKMAVDELVPESRSFLKIPSDHLIGYAMPFGSPAVKYARTAQRGPANTHTVG